MPRSTLALVCLLLAYSPPSHAAAHDHDVSQAGSPRLQLTGDIGVTAAFAENVAVPAFSISARLYSSEGIGGLLRVGYEGLFYLNFGVIDAAVVYRYEAPGGQWAGFGMGLGLGLSAMIRDSVYHFTGDDLGFAVFGTAGIDVRLGSLIIGLDAIGRWQLGEVPILGPSTREGDWMEAGAVMRIGGEVLL